jgi:hypothetical protein
MRIVGEWFLGDDGITRPVVYGQLRGSDGQAYAERFLVDSAADRSVLSAVFAARLRLPADPPQPGLSLTGIGSATDFVLVTAVMELTRDDGGPARVRGQFAAFTDLAATDLSVLGRDVLDNFDVILSRRRDEVLLLAPAHFYVVSGP